jgi:hypothetical protein
MRIALWAGAVAIAAALLIVTRYQSRDADSALYARLAEDLSHEAPGRWIAPEWHGAWNLTGPFREHPIGILILPVLAIKAGFPAGQASYAVNMLFQIAVIALLPLVAATVVQGVEARSLAWILQLLPVAFVYRIRANQEHPLLMCFLAVLYAAHRVRAHAGWMLLMIAAFCFLVLLKGAFAMFTAVAAALWILIVPPPPGGSNRMAWLGLAITMAAAAAMMAGYEALYRSTTGESFFAFYGGTRLGESISLTNPEVVRHAAVNAGWYLTRLMWFAAPWSLFAAGATIAWVRSRAGAGAPFDTLTERGLLWALLVTAMFIAVLSPALVRAERFIFPIYFVIGAVGVVTAIRNVERIRGWITSTDRLTWLPPTVWLGTFLLNLGSRVVR